MKLKLGVVLLLTVLHAQAEPVKYVSAHDGDTLTIKTPKSIEVIRVHYLDTPEMKSSRWPAQPYAYTAWTNLKKLCANARSIDITRRGFSYDRIVADVSCDGTDLATYQVQNGSGWAYTNATKKLKTLQLLAQQTKQGLWKYNKPIPPWEWRKGLNS